MKLFTILLTTIVLSGLVQPLEAAPHRHLVRPPVYRPPYTPPPTPRERKEVQAQIRLRQLGYYRGPIDGDIGRFTSRAISRFQHDQRLPITGWLDVRTLRALGVI